VDMCVGETAMLLAEACHLLGPSLDDVSPVIRQRVRREVTTRLVEPVVAHDDWFWGRGRHNWSTWIAANTLGAGSYLLEDRALDRELVWTLMGLVDRFLARYGEDGGCDEGPQYWTVAGGMVLLFLECLRDRSGGRIDLYGEEKIRNIGRYMVTAHLSGPFFTNFADTMPRVKVHPERLWRFGERCDDRRLKNLALLAMRGYELDAPVAEADSGTFGEDLGSFLRQLWWLDAEAKPTPLPRERHTWLPSIEVMVAREEDREDLGLVLAAKAGHNTESHNHLDVGQVIVLLDGRPALVDVGTGCYSGKNFSPARYDIWYVGTEAHGAPVINGHGQQAGPGFGHLAERTVHSGFSEEVWHAAENVRCTGDEARSELSMDMAACYADDAGIHRVHRTIGLSRGDDPAIDIVDDITVREGPLAVDLTLVSPLPATKPLAGVIHLDCGDRLLELRHPEDMDSVLDEKKLDDELLREAWGDLLTLIRLTLNVERASAAYEIHLRAVPR